METLAQKFIELFDQFGYWAVFFGVMLENAGIPVPGETILLFAAFLAYGGDFYLPYVIGWAIFGATLGDNMGFLLGRWGGRRMLERFTSRSRILHKRLLDAERFFHAHGSWTVFIARFVTGLRVFAGPLAGALQMRWTRFLFYNFTGAVVWSISISLVGYFFGSQWPLLLKIIKRVNVGIFAVVLLAGFLLWRRHKRRQAREAQESPQPETVAGAGSADKRD